MAEGIRDIIRRVADEEGIDPNYALAVADRESSFDPHARASKTIHGLFQMSGGLRNKYGIGNSTDPETQTRGWAAFHHDLQDEMRQSLGRNPTNSETYLGHYWGSSRAAHVLSGRHGGLSTRDLFTPYELSLNPELARAGSASSAAANIMGDIGRRQRRQGDSGGRDTVDFAAFGQPEQVDFAQFGQAQSADGGGKPPAPRPGARPGQEIDLSQFAKPPQPQAWPQGQPQAQQAWPQPVPPQAQQQVAALAPREGAGNNQDDGSLMGRIKERVESNRDLNEMPRFDPRGFPIQPGFDKSPSHLGPLSPPNTRTESTSTTLAA